MRHATLTRFHRYWQARKVQKMTEQEFVAKSVNIQVGGASSFTQGKKALYRALKGSSGMAVAYVPAEKQFYALDNSGRLQRVSRASIERNAKTKGALESVLGAGPEFEFVIDMQDRRLRTIAEDGSAPFPVFCFNRHHEDRQRILWPLPIYHELGGEQFLSDMRPGAVDWEDKVSRVIWRGTITGRSKGTGPGRGEGMRVKTAYRRFRRGDMGKQKLLEIVSTAPRYRAVAFATEDERYDFGFVDGGGYKIAQTLFHTEFERPRVRRSDMQRFKYIAVLRGVDVGSSFYWVMNSGSVGFVQDTPFVTFASPLFKPWRHYIPFAEDCSNLNAAYEWAENKPFECQKMARDAARICSFLAEDSLRQKISLKVVDVISNAPKIESGELA